MQTPTKPQASNSPSLNQVTSNQRPVTPSEGKQRSPARGISGLDLMEMLLRASPTKNGQDLKTTPYAVNSSPVKMASPCHLQLGSPQNQYKDVSDHLKSILKVSA
jgi:hypothetical protein